MNGRRHIHVYSDRIKIAKVNGTHILMNKILNASTERAEAVGAGAGGATTTVRLIVTHARAHTLSMLV